LELQWGPFKKQKNRQVLYLFAANDHSGPFKKQRNRQVLHVFAANDHSGTSEHALDHGFTVGTLQKKKKKKRTRQVSLLLIKEFRLLPLGTSFRIIQKTENNFGTMQNTTEQRIEFKTKNRE